MPSPAAAAVRDVDFDVTLRQYKVAIEVFVVGTLCALGLAGNLLSIVVLGRDHSIRRTTGFMLQMLAVADAVYLVACLSYQTLNCVVKFTDWLPADVGRRWPYVEAYAWPLASVAQTATVWLVVVVTADRYIAICHPLHAAHYSTMTRVRRAVATVWIFAASYNLPRFFERVVDVSVAANSTTPDVTSSELVAVTSSRPETVVSVQRTALREHPVYVLVYKTCFFFVVRFLIPFAALAFFNQRLIRAMRASDHIRLRSTRHVGGVCKERQHTRTLVVVVVVFVVCELPDLTLRAWISLYRYAPTIVSFPRRQLLYVNIASNLLLTVNSCINFVIYCFMGRRFRAILLRMVDCGGDESPRHRQESRPFAPKVLFLSRRTLRTTTKPRRQTF